MKSNSSNQIKNFFSEIHFSRNDVWDFALILVGALIQAAAMSLFLVPADLVSGGISGLAQLIHH